MGEPVPVHCDGALPTGGPGPV
eukprot:COSAG01_NODE_52765_length_344_cov_0.848980_1_plen_21_part_10